MEIIVTTIVFIFSLVILLNSLINFISNISLKEISNLQPDKISNLSILIPVRNEEKNISTLLDSLIKTNIQPLEVIVLNDSSTDSTLDILNNYKKTYPQLKIINGKQLETGWRGKTWAMQQLIEESRGEYLLFLDADVVIHKHTLETSLKYLIDNNLQLLSLMPNQKTNSIIEKLTIPLLSWIIFNFLPLVFIKYSSELLVGANGQFMLFEKQKLEKINGFDLVKHSVIDDIEIARVMKKNGFNVGFLFSDNLISCRMYNDSKSLINGLTRSINGAVGNSKLILIILIVFFGVIILEMFRLNLYLLFILFISQILQIFKLKDSIFNIILLPVRIIALEILIIITLIKNIKNNFEWKGRAIK